MTKVALEFPGGTVKVITIAATAGNVAVNESPGALKTWVLESIRLTVVCDATVVNRRFQISLQNVGGTVTYASVLNHADAITASQTIIVEGLLNTPSIDTKDSSANFSLGIPRIILVGTERLNIALGGGVAGDSYSGTMRVRELGINP